MQEVIGSNPIFSTSYGDLDVIDPQLEVVGYLHGGEHLNGLFGEGLHRLALDGGRNGQSQLIEPLLVVVYGGDSHLVAVGEILGSDALGNELGELLHLCFGQFLRSHIAKVVG